jgi:hypothetical protein
MIGAIVFVTSFLFLFIVTLFFPVLPPGQMLVEAFENAESNYLFVGFSEELIVASLINGLLWGVIIAVVFSYWRGPSKGKIDLPVWVPRYVTSDGSEVKEKASSKYSKSSFKKVRDSNVAELIDIVGPKIGRDLGKIGIRTLNDLTDVCATRTGQIYIAKKVGVSPLTVIYWVQQAEMRK